MHKCVTKFMLQTCRYTSTSPNTLIAHYCRCISRIILSTICGDCQLISSGSSAELYITPMLSCIDDIDVMYCLNSCLAIPAGQTPHTELPDHYHPVVAAYEIVDSPKPGYVYLQQSYVLTKADNGRYVVEKIQNKAGGTEFTASINGFSEMIPDVGNILRGFFLGASQYSTLQDLSLVMLNSPRLLKHGPAITSASLSRRGDLFGFSLSGHDGVACVRCLVWPPQAANWITRSRNHGWPDSPTIHVVTQNGCDVVGVAHPSCRQDEWMSNYQWRLSFSRAEVTLLNSWTPVQQIIYHMLRFFIKRQVLSNSNDDPNLPKLSNYHIKTLMMWECEQKPQSWWSAESSLIKLCSSLLHKLSDYVAARCCPQYFVSNCNILDHFVNDDEASLALCNRLKSLATEKVLLRWFVENYIRECVQYFPPELSLGVLFKDISSNDKLERAVQAVISCKLHGLALESVQEHHVVETAILANLQMYDIDAKWALRVIRVVMEELESFNHHIRDTFVAAATLHVAYKISIHSATENVFEVLWSLFNPCTAASGDTAGNNETKGLTCIRKAVKLASLSTAHSDVLQMLYNEMSKAYLHHSFVYGLESTYCVVHVLLAALYYKSGHYQAAIDHCKQVLNQSACEQYGLHSIAAEYLPQIDENVDVVLGLITFYQHLDRKALNREEQALPTSKPSFTIELLTNYLYSQCSAARQGQLSVYQRHLTKTNRPSVGDVLLFRTMQIQSDESKGILANEHITSADNENNSASSMDTSLLVISLELVALEKLTTCRQMMVRELHSEQYPVINEFEALYAYKCGLFEQCLHLCRSYVDMFLRARCPPNVPYLVMYPEMLSVLDGELVSLCGVVRLLYPVLWLLRTNCPNYCDISVATLSLYLMVQCQKKLGSDSLHETLRLILLLHKCMVRTNNDDLFIDRLILRMTYRSLKLQYAESRRANELS